MTITEKLKQAQKKAKKAIVTGALAMAAVAAPIKGQSAEAAPEKEPAKTVQMTQEQKERQQLLETAVRANLPKEEVAKYVDFPAFLPVDKKGQLDEKQVNTLLSGLVTNNIEAVKNFYKAVQPINGHDPSNKKKFDEALATFVTDISGDKKEAFELLKKISETTDDKWSDMKFKVSGKFVNKEKSTLPQWMLFAGALLMLYSGYKSGFIAGDTKNKFPAGVFAGLVVIGLGAFWTMCEAEPNGKDLEKRLSDPKEAMTFMQDGVKKVYDAYLIETIQAEKDRQTDAARIQFNRQVKKSIAVQKR